MANQFPTWGAPQTIEQLCASASFAQLHVTMQERVRALIEASEGRVGLGVGWRSAEQQRAMFLDRYEVHEHGKTMWEGKRWRKKASHLATAAPPGRSMHEIGLAADLAGDHAWVVSNAGRFALKHFAFVNNEPWHVQPFELPNSRREYERAGKPWQSGMPIAAPDVPAQMDVPAAQVDAAPPEAPVLEIVPGMRGPVVGELQDVLIRLGLMKDCVANRDEYYGPGTQEVVKRFQQRCGLRVDGRVGKKTWAGASGRLNGQAARRMRTSDSPAPRSTR